MQDLLVSSKDDFESLPPAVQRKFFSNVERFRLLTTQHNPRYHAQPRRGHDANRPLSIRRRGCTKPSTSVITSPKQRTSRQNACLRRRHSPLTNINANGHSVIGRDLNLVQEYWQSFHSLPPKIQKFIFSKEEQYLLQQTAPAACHILDAADRVLLKFEERQKAGTRNRRSIRTDSSSLMSEELTISSKKHQRRSGSIAPSSVSIVPSLSVEEEPSSPDTDLDPADHSDSGIEMEESILDSFRWLDEDEDLDLSLDGYHKYVSDAAMSSQNSPKSLASPRRMPSFRRTLSFARNRNSTMIGSNGRTLNSSQSATTPFSSSNTRPVSRQSRHISHRSTSSIDPAAQYYQDPEARLKLRVYLASPQKFDEAIEFGFPSLEDKENNTADNNDNNNENNINNNNNHTHNNVGHSRRHTMNRDSKRISLLSSSSRGWTFLDDETTSVDLSLLDEFNQDQPPFKRLSQRKKLRRDDNETMGLNNRETSSLPPSTPSSNTRRPQPLKPLSSSGNANANAGGRRREMTLKMTLTRPDLRMGADSAFPSLYDNQDDPLRLAELPPADESVNIWDDLPGEKGVVKKMWRRLRSWRD